MTNDLRIWQRLLSVFGLVFVATLSVGCNHLFYHPDYDIHSTPASLRIPFKEYRLQVSEYANLHVWHLDAGEDSNGTVVHFHGNAENMTTHYLFVSWLVKSGYDVVTFDYRGYGQSTGVPSREGLVEDGRAVIDWVRGHPKLGNEDIFLFGQSLGGAVVIPSLEIAGSKGIRAVVVESTFSSYRAITRDKLGSVWLTWPLHYPLSFLVSDDWSPIDSVEKLTIPILVVHGVNDRVVPIKFGRQLFDAAPPKLREFWEVEIRGHTSAFYRESSSYRVRLVDYLCRKSTDPQECKP